MQVGTRYRCRLVKQQSNLMYHLQLLAVQPYRDGSVIEQFDLHIRTEDAARHFQPIGGNSFLEALDQRLCYSGGSGIGKAGTASSAHISVEGELRDDKGLAADVEQGAVHLALFIFEDAQVDDFFAERLDLRPAIAVTDAKQYQQSPAYFADNLFIDSDTGTAYSL